MFLVAVDLKLALKMPTSVRLEARLWTDVHLAIKCNIVVSRKPKKGI